MGSKAQSADQQKTKRIPNYASKSSEKSKSFLVHTELQSQNLPFSQQDNLNKTLRLQSGSPINNNLPLKTRDFLSLPDWAEGGGAASRSGGEAEEAGTDHDESTPVECKQAGRGTAAEAEALDDADEAETVAGAEEEEDGGSCGCSSPQVAEDTSDDRHRREQRRHRRWGSGDLEGVEDDGKNP